MEVKAYHIAATIVAAHLSRHHNLRGVFTLSEKMSKADHIFFDANKSVDTLNGEVPREQDPDVLLERAIIDLSGHEAEEIYYIVNHLPDHGRRISDHQALMDDAMNGIGDLDVSRADLVRQTLDLVSRNWFAVRDLARLLALSEDGSLDSIAAMQRLNKIYNHQAVVA